MTAAPQPAPDSANHPSGSLPKQAATSVAAPALTVEQQVSHIQKKLAEHTIGSDRDTHRVNNPIWDEKENK